ncbi:MAG TPA: branched-chain amino acid ABC transporter permease [Mycobacteriales bacterium]|nr:branched-chain amino acid ABC transporter permease [Mycobacteriales bacterium]
MTASAIATPGPFTTLKVRVGWSGAVLRALVVGGIGALVVWACFYDKTALDASRAATYAVVGLSMNVLVGYTGQLSLGQQGFVALGGMVAANVAHTGTAAADPWRFAFCFLAAGAVTAVAAFLLGVVALRVQGLYFALLTLIFGSTIVDTLLSQPSLNGQGTGLPANNPTFLRGDTRFALFCFAVLAVCVYVDRRVVASKVGRSFVALREDERAAQAFGINVRSAKLLAFALAGALAGIAGGLYAFASHQFSQKDFTDVPGFNLALTFVVMAVVGGLGSRAGVVVGSAFFAVLPDLLHHVFTWLGGGTYYGDHSGFLTGLVGALLLLQTLIMNPGGLGQVLRPVTRWLGGGPLFVDKHETFVLPGTGTGSMRV